MKTKNLKLSENNLPKKMISEKAKNITASITLAISAKFHQMMDMLFYKLRSNVVTIM